ncbi:uncharacterized protein [Miscanthus floridulus]|uniref:uncharacterized protein isoform X2 n=1 Tax=Miscanthus floridulus TaxID=154761 RepID=UPI0034584AE0
MSSLPVKRRSGPVERRSVPVEPRNPVERRSGRSPVERRRGRNAAERRSGSPPVERGRGLPSPSSQLRIDPNIPMGKLRTTLGDGFVDNFGIALLLFETPSGFAIFGFFALYLYRPDARESLWANFDMYERARHIVFLEEFQTFDDKSIAINVDTGVNSQLTEMIMKYYRPGHTLVVGNEEYKSIIESSLEIPCLYDGIVVELMWGMQHLMHRLVPGEKSELPKEDRVPMSEGLKMFLSGYGYNVKPEMVNEQIVSAASSLFHCNAVEKKEYPAFLRIGRLLKDLSGIDYKNWGALPLAAAFNIILTHKINDFDEISTKVR